MPKGIATGSLYAQNGQRKYLNAEERARFLRAARDAPAQVRTFCLTLAHTGCRISEALNLTAADIQRTSGSIAIRCLKKRGKVVVREVPVPGRLLAELARVHKLGQQRREGLDARLWGWGRTTAWRLVKEVMADAGLRWLAASPKGLRHAFGVHAICSGVPLNLVQKWLGHADIATTAIYANALGPEERAIASRMW
ncbi:tyrosine-type recombinase/integrase [Xanthobacter wiegelii]|uniref:tyrosine-type recombinase/integrase n=1 Tax=Xanthobacter wiegelii TaxID=3119913 RepID=UPI0037296B5C